MEGLTADQIDARLELNDPSLVKKILSYAEQFWKENLEYKRLGDEKAQKGFGLAAVCLTLLFTMGTFLAQSHKGIPHPGIYYGLFSFSGSCLIFSVLSYFIGSRPLDVAVLGAPEIINQSILLRADKHGMGLIEYERHMAGYFLRLGTLLHESHRETFAVRRRAQTFLVAGLTGIALTLLYFVVFVGLA